MNLLVRFFLVSLLIAGSSIAVTAWLASQATTGALRQEQGDAIANDARIYDALLAYAATHPSWDDARSEVDRIAREHNRRIVLVDGNGRKVVDTGTAESPALPVTPKATIDPLYVDPVLKPDVKGPIDPRAVGPWRINDLEKQKLWSYADALKSCSGSIKIIESPNGRPRLATVELGTLPYFDQHCEAGTAMYEITWTETQAGQQLAELVTACLTRKDLVAWAERMKVSALDWEWVYLRSSPQGVVDCMESSRREQLQPYVAPAVRLYLTELTGGEPRAFDLSPAGATRIALVALGILALAGFASWLTARQLVRPVRALTAATKLTAEGDRTVRVAGGQGEIGELARSFNAMSEKLADTERQRQAMVSDIAHELRTPLGNITGWLEATQDGLAQPDPQLVAMLLEESLLLQRLVDDLHDLAQADAGTLRLHPEPIALDDVAEQVVAAQQNRAVTIETTPVHITADPVRIRQAIGNLVANAVRYTPSGGSVTVRVFQDSEAVVEVADTGVGIAAEDLPHVFDRFWRADKSRSRSTGGSGLGLAITRHLVEAHGGTVTVTSTPGAGSTFRIRLPR